MRLSKQGFEIETCGRCGGSGNHSFNQMDGTRCYGCGGSGVVLTKRGKAAANWFDEVIYRPVSEIKAGDVVENNGRWQKCQGVEPNANTGYITILLPGSAYMMQLSGRHQSARSKAVLAGLRRFAWIYQDILTKAGKVAKKHQEKAKLLQQIKNV